MDRFFRANRVFAVAGASKDTSKYGHKVLKWYKDHNIPVVPINPKMEEILGLSSVKDITKVPVPANNDLALSVVTPPAITKAMLESVDKTQGKVETIWLQPGSYDKDVLDLAVKVVPTVITDCVLKNGEYYLPSKL